MADVTPTPAAPAGGSTPNSWGVITPAVSAPTSGANSWGVVLPSTAPKVASTPAAQPAINVKPVDTSSAFSKFIGLNNLTNPTPAPTSATTPSVTAPQLKNTDDSIGGVIKNTVTGIPAAVKTVADDINAPLAKASDLLSNTNFIKQAATGMNADPKAGLAAQVVLKKLSDASAEQFAQGATGGLYKAQDTGTDDAFDTGIKSIAQVLGSLPTIGGIGKTLTPAIDVTPKIAEFMNKVPLAGKYLTPYIDSFINGTAKTAVGLAGYSQLNPDLGTDLTARFKAAATNVAEAPLYESLGLLKSPYLSIPASGIMGFGMAKLSGASNTEALKSGLLFSVMDGYGKLAGNRGLTDQEVQDKISTEAFNVLNKYSDDVKLTANSTPAQVDAVYNRAVHQASPKVGGNAQELEAVKSAYDIVSKGTVSNTQGKTAPETSVDTLHTETKAAIKKFGPDGATQIMKDNLGVDHETAQRIVTAAQAVHEPADIRAAIRDDVTAKLGARSDEEITTQSTDFVNKNIDKLSDDYISKFGNEVGTDEAKELIPGYSDNREIGHLVADSASKVAQHAFEKLVAQDKGDNNQVLISAGGTGAGKSTLLRSGVYNKDDYAAIRDSNMNNSDAAIKRIDGVLAKGKDVDIAFVYAPIKEAYNRALSRTEDMTQKLGSGRPVAAQGHIETHYGSYDTMEKLLEHYKDEPRVKIKIYDNSGNGPTLVKDPLAFIKEVIYNKQDEESLHKDLNSQRIAAHREGGISSKTNHAYERAEAAQPRRAVAKAPEELPADSGKGTQNGRVAESVLKDTSSKIGKSIEAKAIEAGLTKGFPETAGYDATTFKEQAEKAAALFDSGLDNARAVIRGDEPLPDGLKGEAVIAAAEEYLLKNPDAEMAEELANSPLVTANSESAQGLVLSKMRQPDSATAKLQKLKADKIASAGGTKEVAKVRAKAKAEMNKVLLPKEETSWDNFLDGITC